MRPQVVTITSVINDVDNIATSQTVTGLFTLDGTLVVNGVAILPNAQWVSLTDAGDQSAVNVTITGKNANGAPISETIAGPNANTVTTSQYFKEVLSVSSDAAITASVGVSNLGGAVSKIITANWRERQFKVGMGLTFSTGAVASCDVEHTFDDINDLSATLNWFNTFGLTTATTSAESNIAFPCRGVRLHVNTWTSGTVTLTYIQA